MTRTQVRSGFPNAVGYSVGRSVRSIQALTEQRIVSISPIKAGVVVAAVWGGITAISNTRKYLENKISKKRAIADTARESAGVGISATMGLLVGNGIRLIPITSAATATVTLLLTVISTAAFKAAWDNITDDLIDKFDQRPTRTDG
jgi:uncharacterized membrane protein